MANDKDGQRRRSGNPAVRAGAVDPAARTQGRDRLERRSWPWLVRLAAIPRWMLVVGALVLVVAGLLIPGAWGAALLLVVAAFLIWLLALSWPAIDVRGRLVRAVGIGIVVFDAGWKIKTGR